MTKLRQLWLLTAVGALAILGVGYFVLVSPKASKAASLRAEAQQQVDANTRLKGQIAQLNKQKKDLPKQQAELEKFAAKIPNNPALPSLVRALSDAAENSGVDLVSMSPATPVLVPAAAGGLTTAASATSPATPLSLAQIPISVQIDGTYSQVSQFLAEIEGMTRAFLVSGVTMKEAPAKTTDGAPVAEGYSGVLRVQLTGSMFMTAKVAPPAPVVAKPADDNVTTAK
jgi:Tfp pilus assembly protein PilO